MEQKSYRFIVNKIPLGYAIPYKKPNFGPMPNLHLDLLENIVKVKKNAPKPIFVPPPPSAASTRRIETFKDRRSSSQSKSEDDILDELEREYDSRREDNHRPRDDDSRDDLFRDDSSSGSISSTSSKRSSRSHRDRGKDRESPKGSPKRSNAPASVPAQKSTPTQPPADYAAETEPVDTRTAEERENDERSKLLFNFMVLRKKYPNVEIPEFTEHSDLSTMKKVYDHIIRRVTLDSNVDTYREYLKNSMLILEFVLTNWVGIDFGGFALQQEKSMNKYDHLLIELGEKNYSTLGSRFPVELRLIFFVLLNAGMFYIQKTIFTGGNLFSMFGGGGSKGPQQSPPQRRGGGMKGPTLTPDQVESLSGNK